MTLPKNPEELDEKVLQIIAGRIANTAAETESGWAIAYVLMRMLPELKSLTNVVGIVGEDLIAPALRNIAHETRRIANKSNNQ
jgi:hypothetical protein